MTKWDSIKNSFVCQWISNKYLPELRILLKLSWPIMLMNLCRYLNPTISVIMCGHLTKVDFDAASLANTLMSVFGVVIDFGFSTACDTLFAQVYGSKNKKKLGLMLQRAMLVMTLVFLVLACLHLNIEPFLILLYQDVEISRKASKYVALYLPGLFFDFHFLGVSRYLQNQNIVYPMMIASIIGALFNGVVQYIFIYVFNFGIEASAIIQAMACAIMFFIQFFYIIISKVYRPTWQGIEFTNALQEWGIFFKLGIPGIVMIAIEDWTFEIAYFVAGALSDVQLGAQSVAFQTAFLFFMIHCGIAIAGTIRSGQFLGANKPEEAALSAKVAVITDWIMAIFTFTIILTCRRYIAMLFTNDSEIQAFAEQILVLIALIQFLDSSISQGAGIFRACGKQATGAVIMVVCFYIVGVPLAMVLMFVVKTDIRGFWVGLMVALAMEVTIYFIIIYRINWQNEALKAASRIQESRLSESHQDESIVDTFKDMKIKETTSLIEDKEVDEIDDSEYNPIKISKSSHRRPTSGVTDILMASIKEMPNVSSYNKLNKTTVIKRLVFFGIVMIMFILSLFSKFYLPRKWFIPCIENEQSTLALDKHYPFCNDTIYTV